MAFLVLDPRIVAHLIQGEIDELTPKSKEKLDKIKSMACPRCKASMHPRVHDQPFTEHDPLPRMVATCECGMVVNPENGIVIELGSASKVMPSIPIIKAKEES